MEVDGNGRYKDQEGFTDLSFTLLQERPGVETSTSGGTQNVQQRIQDLHGRTVGSDRRTLPQFTRKGSTMALDTVHIDQARDVRLVDDWMNPWPIPGEETLNTIKETYAKIKKRLFSKTNENC